MNMTFMTFKSDRSRRGSILFMTVAVLAVMGVIATTILFSTRIETQSSANAGKAVQDRMSAVSSIGNVIDYVQSLSGAVPTSYSLLQPAVMGPAFKGNGAALDQSALMNINTFNAFTPGPEDADKSGQKTMRRAQKGKPDEALSDALDIAQQRSESFRKFLGSRIQKAGVPASQASQVAQNIAAWRQSGEKSPGAVAGVARSSARKMQSDSKPTSATKTPRFNQLEDLMDVPGMTPEVYAAIAPWLTVDSASLDIWFDPQGKAYARAPLNEMDALQLFALLKTSYPDKDENLLRQVAVNIVDRRDADSVPTVFPDQLGSLPIIGFERGLVISEVCPDVITLDADGDNGEYIELFNPLDKAIDLTGYTVSWAASGASQGQALLNGKLEAGAHLIVTDDLKNDLDPTPETTAGMGSFYDVFKALPLGNDRVIEIVGMDIPNSRGTIALTDPDGNLVDYIIYDAGAFNGINRGFEKSNLFVHTTTVVTPALPFRNSLSPPAGDKHKVACWEWTLGRMDQPFISAGELLTIPQLFTPAASLEPAPVTVYPSLASGADDGLDARLLDMFTLQDRPLEMVFDDEGEPVEVFFQTSRSVAKISEDENIVLAPVVQGLINMNTSPVEILQLVPGVDAELAKRLVRLRQADGDPLVLGSLSDLAGNDVVWESQTASERLESLIQCAPSVSFMSSSWYVQSKDSGHIVTAWLSFSPQGGLEIIDWKYE